MGELQALATAIRLRQNIREILRLRNETPSQLAFGLGMHPTWINKFLNGHRQIQMKHIDRIAAYFGIEPYELLMPGISHVGERREAPERRSGLERRIGHPLRRILEVKAELTRARSPQVEGHEEDRRSLQLPAPIPALIRQLAQQLERVSPAPQPRRQAPRARRAKPKGRVGDRGDRGSAAPKTD